MENICDEIKAEIKKLKIKLDDETLIIDHWESSDALNVGKHRFDLVRLVIFKKGAFIVFHDKGGRADFDYLEYNGENVEESYSSKESEYGFDVWPFNCPVEDLLPSIDEETWELVDPYGDNFCIELNEKQVEQIKNFYRRLN